MRLFQAITSMGGFTEFAKPVKLIRGKKETKYDMRRIKEDGSNNPFLLDGDQIILPGGLIGRVKTDGNGIRAVVRMPFFRFAEGDLHWGGDVSAAELKADSCLQAGAFGCRFGYGSFLNFAHLHEVTSCPFFPAVCCCSWARSAASCG
jgi:hypothetical protein